MIFALLSSSITANGDLLALSDSGRHIETGSPCYYSRWPCVVKSWNVQEGGWVRSLIRGRRVVVVTFYRETSGGIERPAMTAAAYFRRSRAPELSAMYEIEWTGGADYTRVQPLASVQPSSDR